MTQSEKTTKIAVIDQKINKLQVEIGNLQKQKEAINKQTTLESFKLSSHIKSILEADDIPDPEKTKAAPSNNSSDDSAEEPEAENTPTKKDLTVKFNMAKVKKYNKYPVITNTGTVTGVTKDGIAVLVNDNTIFVAHEDII